MEGGEEKEDRQGGNKVELGEKENEGRTLTRRKGDLRKEEEDALWKEETKEPGKLKSLNSSASACSSLQSNFYQTDKLIYDSWIVSLPN